MYLWSCFSLSKRRTPHRRLSFPRWFINDLSQLFRHTRGIDSFSRPKCTAPLSFSLSVKESIFIVPLLTTISIFARSIRHEIFSFHFVAKQPYGNRLVNWWTGPRTCSLETECKKKLIDRYVTPQRYIKIHNGKWQTEKEEVYIKSIRYPFSSIQFPKHIYIYFLPSPFPSTFTRKTAPFPATTQPSSNGVRDHPLAVENPKLTWSEGNKQKCLGHSSPIVVGHFLTRAEPRPPIIQRGAEEGRVGGSST